MSKVNPKLKIAINYINLFNILNIDKTYIEESEKLQGLSGAGTAQIISNVAKLLGTDQYLEIGIYQASNFLQIAKNNKNIKCYGVDNFSEAFQENENYKNLTTEEVVHKRINDYQLNNCTIIKDDFRNFLKTTTLKNIELYFFDGPHGLQDQIDGVEMALPLLADEAIIFIDDWRSENVRDSTKILLEKYKELSFIRVLTGPLSNRHFFNQDQVVLKFKRNI